VDDSESDSGSVQMDSDLALLIERWPDLPPHVRQAIVMLARGQERA
jgi:hypothetical protein